ncbi:MAG: peroxiredoxin, partial [Acidobacteriaceae bacterium]
YPIIGDTELKVAKLYDMLPADAGNTSEGRTPALNATVRNVYLIGPDKRIKLILIYPMSAGRNFYEILRALDAIQITAKHPVSTPANWKPGEDIVIGGSVSNEQAATQFPGFKTVKPYLRTAAPPK